MKKATLLLAILVLNPTTLWAEDGYYTWVDDNGVTNYSEHQPGEYEAKLVASRHAFGRKRQSTVSQLETPTNSDLSRSTTTTGTIDPDALVAAETARLKKEVTQTKRSNCEVGKRNLAQLQAYSRIRVSDEKGENRILTPDEKLAKADEARAVIKENCAP